jgi:hypothetical protein
MFSPTDLTTFISHSKTQNSSPSFISSNSNPLNQYKAITWDEILISHISRYQYVFLMFYVLKAMIMKSTAFWVLTPCNSEKARRFGGTYRFQLQHRSEKLAEARGKLLLLARLTLRSWRWKRYPARNIGCLQNRWRYNPDVRTFRYAFSHSMMRFQVFTV